METWTQVGWWPDIECDTKHTAEWPGEYLIAHLAVYMWVSSKLAWLHPVKLSATVHLSPIRSITENMLRCVLCSKVWGIHGNMLGCIHRSLHRVYLGLYSYVWWNISKMYFSHWEPPGVCERRWSLNLEALISGENQTLGGQSGPQLEYLWSVMSGMGAPWERLWKVWEHLGLSPNDFGNPKLTLRDAGFWRIFIRRTAGVVWDSRDVHEQ